MSALLTALARLIPAQGVAGATVAQAAGLGATALGPLAQATYGPLTRWADYEANYFEPNAAPPAESLIRLYHGGQIGRAALQELLRVHGIWWKTQPPSNEKDTAKLLAWQRYIENTRPTWGADQYRKWLRQGRLPLFNFNEAMSRMGMGLQADRDLFEHDYENLPLPTLITMRQYGIITDDQFKDLCFLLGYRRADSAKFLITSATRPGFAEAIQLRQLGVIDDDRLSYYLNSAGFTEPDVQLDVQAFRNVLPSTTAILATAGRNSWDGAFAGRWNLDNEAPAQLQPWAARLGIDYPAGVGPFGQPDPASPTWTQIAWRDHWRLFDPGTLQEVIRRVRGNPADPNTWSIPGLPPLTTAQMDDCLRTLGYAPTARPYILGLATTPISVRHVRMILTHFPQPRAWVVGKYQDMGYADADAGLVADALIEDVRLAAERPLAMEIRRANRHLQTTVLSAYADGAVNRLMAASTLAKQGMDGGVIDTLLNATDVSVNAGIVKTVTSRARSDWFAGRTNLAGATQRLLSANMDPARVSQIVASWQAERGEGRIVLATNKILSLLRKGFIGADEATIRLDNLGWNKPDELLLLAEVAAEIDADAAKAAAAADMAKQKAIREMERLLSANQARADRIRREMERQTPVASILKWIRDGLMTQAAATHRLALMGYDSSSIANMLAEDRFAIAEGKTAKAEIHAHNLELQRRLFPPSRIAKYVIDGIWTRQQAAAKLGQLDYTAEAIKAMLDDAELHRKK